MTRFAVLLGTCAALAPLLAIPASIEAQVRDPAGKPVADAVVFAMPASGPLETRGTRIVEVEQLDREFVPHVSVIQTGTSVSFPNRDPILHHVYSFSPAKSFESKLYTGKSPSEVRFDKPGIVTLGCNIHDWMLAHVAVVSTPHFARSNDRGVALALEAATQHRAQYVLELEPRKPRYKPPLDGFTY